MAGLRMNGGTPKTTGREKVYRLTAAGRRQLRAELDRWNRLSSAVGLVIEAV